MNIETVFNYCNFYTRPAHAILRDKSKKAIILAIRGTMSIFDCLTDATCDYE